jgi:hypothetical protein
MAKCSIFVVLRKPSEDCALLNAEISCVDSGDCDQRFFNAAAEIEVATWDVRNDIWPGNATDVAAQSPE